MKTTRADDGGVVGSYIGLRDLCTGLRISRTGGRRRNLVCCFSSTMLFLMLLFSNIVVIFVVDTGVTGTGAMEAAHRPVLWFFCSVEVDVGEILL